jgi:hypothetical protein
MQKAINLAGITLAMFLSGLCGLSSLIAQDSPFPQSSVSLTGTVTDPGGAVVPNARIALFLNGSAVRQTATDSSGRFTFGDLKPAIYDVKVTVEGFKETTLQGIALRPGQAQSLTIRVDVGVGPRYVTFTKPVWNAWAEEFSDKPQFSPVPKLKKNTVYELVIDLAALSYSDVPGLYHAETSDAFVDWVSKTKADSATLDVLLIPDHKLFAPQAQNEQVKQLKVNLAKIRDAQKHGFKLKSSPFDELRSGHDKFNFGRITAKIKTQDFAGKASIAASFWFNGIPLDELAIPFCVVENDSDACPITDNLGITLRGIDSLRIASSKNNAPYPDAALHFIELDPASVVGVLRCNSCSDWKKDQFVTWQIDRSADFIAKYLSGTIIHDFETPGTTADSFKQHGEDLFDLLFHGSDSGMAKNMFVQFLNKNPKTTGKGTIPASIFVRLLPSSTEPLFLVPLGLLYAPGYDDFVGLHYRIETPLERQDYTASAACISKWVLVVPEDDPAHQYDDMQQARAPFAPFIGQFQKWTNSTVYQKMGPFRSWLRQGGSAAESDAVLILSHHDSNRIYFDPSDTVESVSVQRPFAVPSLAIINACGTAKPGAIEFVREFNDRGVSAEVATASEVEPRMAGLFATSFVQHLQDHAKDSDYGVAQARFDAVVDVSQMAMTSGEKYGPRALIYVMLGNGGIRACPPSTSSK